MYACLGSSSHGGDKDALNTEGREEGVQIPGEAEGHRLGALQITLLVVGRREVDLEGSCQSLSANRIL